MSRPVLVASPDRLGDTRDIRSWPTGVPGLVVAQIPPESERCIGLWSVLHARSGARLPYCLPDPEAALGLALAVRDAGDWQRPGQEVRAYMRTRAYNTAVAAYRPWRCKHGDHPRWITHDNGVIA